MSSQVQGDDCALKNAKLSEKSKSDDAQRPKKTRFTRAAAIRLKCIDCSAYQKAEVRNCDIRECPLWEFRLGAGRTEPLEDVYPVQAQFYRTRILNPGDRYSNPFQALLSPDFIRITFTNLHRKSRQNC